VDRPFFPSFLYFYFLYPVITTYEPFPLNNSKRGNKLVYMASTYFDRDFICQLIYWRVKIRHACISCKVFSHNLKFSIIILRLFFWITIVDWPRTKSSKKWFNVLTLNLAIYGLVHHCQTYRKTES